MPFIESNATLPTTANLAAAKAAQAAQDQRRSKLRELSQEMVGSTFFAQMLKVARDSKIKGAFGHGGRGEEVFGGQLDQELARRAGQGTKNGLSDAIYKHLVKYV